MLPIELQLAWDPDPEVRVDVVELAMDVFVSELRVLVRANFSGTAGTQGDIGGDETFELKTESLSLSSKLEGFDRISEVLGGFAGGSVFEFSVLLDVILVVVGWKMLL